MPEYILRNARDILLCSRAVLIIGYASIPLLLPVVLAYPLFHNPADHSLRSTVFNADGQGTQLSTVLKV